MKIISKRCLSKKIIAWVDKYICEIKSEEVKCQKVRGNLFHTRSVFVSMGKTVLLGLSTIEMRMVFAKLMNWM